MLRKFVAIALDFFPAALSVAVLAACACGGQAVDWRGGKTGA